MENTHMTLAEYIADRNAKSAAWVAEDPENRWSSGIITDLEHWAEYGITTVEEFVRQELIGDISDTYKSLNGIRPRWMNLSEMSIEELRETADSLFKESRERHEMELRAKREEEERKARLLAPAPAITLGDFFNNN
jgi:hypothetical protein